MRGKAEIVEENGKYKIVITEIPYQVYKSRIVEAIAEAHSEKRIAGIARLDDESNRKGMRVVVELQRNATPNVVLNQLYKHTPLQSSFGFNMLALVPVGRRREPTVPSRSSRKCSRSSRCSSTSSRIARTSSSRRTRYDLRKAEERAHLLEGYRIALDNIDEVIEIVRGSQTTDEAKERLSARFELTEVQAHAIVDMRLRTLVGLERQKIEDEYAELIKTIAELQDILRSPRRDRAIVKSEALDVKKRFGDERRTSIEPAEDEISIEELTPNIDVVVTYTVGGYIKRVSVDTFRTQNRGGRGVIGIANLKREDVVRNFFVAKTHEHVLFFTNKGRVYRLRGYEIPDTTRQARGTALVNLLTLPPGEEVTRGLPGRQVRGREVSRDGHQARRHQEDEARRVRQRAPQRPDRDQSRRQATSCSPSISPTARATSFSRRRAAWPCTSTRRTCARWAAPARGVKAMTLDAGDAIVAMDVVEDERREVLLVTSQAFGKRTPIDEYRHTSRGGKGVKAFARQRDEIGHVVDQILVAPDDELLMITSGNQVIRIKVSEIRKTGRDARACGCSGWAKATK